MNKIVLNATYSVSVVTGNEDIWYEDVAGNILSDGSFSPSVGQSFTLETMENIIDAMVDLQGSE